MAGRYRAPFRVTTIPLDAGRRPIADTYRCARLYRIDAEPDRIC